MEIGACISLEARQSPMKAVKDGCRVAMEMLVEEEREEEEEGDVEENGGKFSGLRFGGEEEEESCH